MRRKLLIAGAVVLLLAVVLVSLFGGRRGKKTPVFAEVAERREITQTVKASGQIQPRIKVNLSAHVIGKIERLYVEEGQAIAAGQPFLELEREAFLAARDDARAQLAMAATEVRQAELSLADQEVRLARAKRLADDGISSSEALESALLQRTSALLRVEQAQETVKQARAQLSKASDDLRKTTLFAPISGRIITLNAEEGEVVVSGTMNNPASVIGTIADLSEVLAEIDVDETEIVHIAGDQLSSIRVDAIPDREYRARVVEIGSSGYSKASQPDVTFFRVKLLLENPDAALRPGMSARAEVSVATHRDAVVVPIQSVVERPIEKGGGSASATGESSPEPGDAERRERQVVFVVVEERAHLRPVRTGISDATEVEVLAGLTAGEQVVTGPQRILRRIEDGEAVRVTSPDLTDRKKKAKQEEETD